MKQFAESLFYVGIALLLVLALWLLRFVVFIFLFSLFIAAAVRPITRYLAKWKIRPVVSQIMIYLIIFSLLGTSIYLVSNLLPEELSMMYADFERGYVWLHETMSNGTASLQSVANWLPPPDEVGLVLQSSENGALRTVLGVGQRIFAVLGGVGVAIVLSVYWSFDQVYFERLWLSAVPANSRARIRDTWRKIEEEIGFYVQSQAIQFVGTFFILFLTFFLLDMPYYTALSVIAAAVALIPFVGVLITITIVFLVGFQVGMFFALMCVGIVIAVSVSIRYFITRYIFDYRQYSSLLVVLTLIPFYETLGLVGFILAPPFTVIAQLFLSGIFRATVSREKRDGVKGVEALKKRMEALSTAIQQEQSETAPENDRELGSLIGRLDSLLSQASEVTDESEKKEKMTLAR